MSNHSNTVFQMTVLAATVALLAGCGGSDDNTTAPTATAKTQPVQIEFVAMAGDQRVNCGWLSNEEIDRVWMNGLEEIQRRGL